MTHAQDPGPAASGAWRGFYVYAPGGERHAMQLDLAFGSGSVSGSGSDDIGPFVIRGGFEPEGVRVWWSKQYVGAHDVWYEGVRDGRRQRVVYGSWSLGSSESGGFKIWRGTSGAAELADAQRADDTGLAGATELADVSADRAALAREVLRR
jgi:hypothetical protein